MFEITFLELGTWSAAWFILGYTAHALQADARARRQRRRYR